MFEQPAKKIANCRHHDLKTRLPSLREIPANQHQGYKSLTSSIIVASLKVFAAIGTIGE